MKKIADIIQAENIYDTLFIEGNNGLAMPHWVNDKIMESLRRITDYTFYFDYSTKVSQKFRAGLFLKDLRTRLKYAVDRIVNEEIETVEHAELKKLYVYSTVSVLNLLIV